MSSALRCCTLRLVVLQKQFAVLAACSALGRFAVNACQTQHLVIVLNFVVCLYSTPAEHLVQGVHGWIASTICTFNDPRMEPHILVIPLRGGDRMYAGVHSDCDPLSRSCICYSRSRQCCVFVVLGGLTVKIPAPVLWRRKSPKTWCRTSTATTRLSPALKVRTKRWSCAL